MGSAAVSWWSVHEYVAPVLARIGEWPVLGCPEWCALPDNDPAKIAAVFDAAQHHALRIELAQESLAQASKDISAAVDWSGIAENLRCPGSRIPREVA